jgi:hypothetical protein
VKTNQHTPDRIHPQQTAETRAERRLGTTSAVTGVLLSWLAIAWLAVAALGVVAGIALTVWGMPLVALAAIYRLDAREAQPSTTTEPAGADASSAPPVPRPAYAGAGTTQRATNAA